MTRITFIFTTDDAWKPERESNAGLDQTFREHLQQSTVERRLHDPLPEQEGHSREEDPVQSSHTMFSRIHRRGKLNFIFF